MGETTRRMSARQNFAKESEDALNQQINAELSASYVYRSMTAYFDRDDVALPGFRDFLKRKQNMLKFSLTMLTNVVEESVLNQFLHLKLNGQQHLKHSKMLCFWKKTLTQNCCDYIKLQVMQMTLK